MKQWCTNYKFSQNEFASRYSTQSYIYTWYVFFAHLSFQTHDPTQPTKNTNFRPIPDPTQPNPRVNPTHGQLCVAYVALAMHASQTKRPQQSNKIGISAARPRSFGDTAHFDFRSVARLIARPAVRLDSRVGHGLGPSMGWVGLGGDLTAWYF